MLSDKSPTTMRCFYFLELNRHLEIPILFGSFKKVQCYVSSALCVLGTQERRRPSATPVLVCPLGPHGQDCPAIPLVVSLLFGA